MATGVFLGIVVVVAALAAGLPVRVVAKESPDGGPIEARSSALAASLQRLHAGSAAWRDAVAALAATGRRAVVVTPDHVRVRDPNGRGDRPFDDDLLAEVQPLADEEARVHLVVVVVNLPLLDKMHASGFRAEFEDDLDRILAHEVYGHAIPYLLAGSLTGRCADPAPGQRATDACAIQRENQVRAELRLGLRREYGLDGLAVARRYRHQARQQIPLAGGLAHFGGVNLWPGRPAFRSLPDR